MVLQVGWSINFVRRNISDMLSHCKCFWQPRTCTSAWARGRNQPNKATDSRMVLPIRWTKSTIHLPGRVMPGWNTNSSPKTTEVHRNQPQKPNWETHEQPLPTGDSIWYGIQFQRWTWEFSQMSSRHLAEEGEKSFEMFTKVFSSLMRLLDFCEIDK